MIKGFYASVSAMLVNANRQQLLAHNVSNMDTPGFKQILSSVEDFMSTRVYYPAGGLQKSMGISYAGTLGLGAMNAPDKIDFTQGGLQTTGNELDLAIQGDSFFHIQTPDGDRYTRDGRFLRDADGTMTTIEGYQVLDQNGQPITLPEGQISVAPEGVVTVNGTQVATLDLASFEDPEVDLQHTEGNYFTATANPLPQASGAVVQGALEMSNANATQIMAQLVVVSRAYEAAQQMVQNQDELLGKTISSLGRIG